MAYRVEAFLESGVIDNRVRGRLTGELHFAGTPSPIKIDLDGDPHPDLAGRETRFERRSGRAIGGVILAPIQFGDAGDITASRKCRVYSVPISEAVHMIETGETPPERLVNAIYIEWFSLSNGRVLIESTDFSCTVGDPSWEPTPEQATDIKARAASAFTRYLERLTENIEKNKHKGPADIEDWDEFDFERTMRESDARTDKYAELLEKYGDSPGADSKIAQAMGWSKLNEELDRDETESTPSDWPIAPLDSIEPDPATEGIDWERTSGGWVSHPLVNRCSHGAVQLWKEVTAPNGEWPQDPILCDLLHEYQVSGAKLAGALNNLAYGRHHQHPAFVVACLKRALVHIHKAHASAIVVQKKALLPETQCQRVRDELFAIREQTLALMKEFRHTG